MPAHLQQGQDQRGELMTHRQAGKAHLNIGAGATNDKRGAACIVARIGDGNQCRLRGDLVEQLAHLRGSGTVVKRGNQLDRLLQTLEISFELSLEFIV